MIVYALLGMIGELHTTSAAHITFTDHQLQGLRTVLAVAACGGHGDRQDARTLHRMLLHVCFRVSVLNPKP